MPRLIAIDGLTAGEATGSASPLPVRGGATYLAQGADRRIRVSQRAEDVPQAGAVIRRTGQDAFRLERLGAAADAPALLVNGEAVVRAELHHGDLVEYGGATLIFDCDDIGASDTAIDPVRASGPVAALGPGPVPALAPDAAALDAALLGGESIRFRQKAYDDPKAAIRGLEESSGPRRDHLAVLLKVATAVGATLDLATLLHRLLHVVFEEIPADRGAILLFDRAAQKLRSMVSKHRGGPAGPKCEVRVSRSIIREAVRTRESILTIDAKTDERFRLNESVAAAGMRSAMCVPILRDGRILGVIHVDTAHDDSREPGGNGGPDRRPQGGAGAFSREDLDLLSAIAAVVALAIENARLYQEHAERERLRGELAVASSIQRHLLPKAPPRTPELDVYGEMIPAKELGGDLFDFIEDERRGTLHLFVGDVCGKGVGSAMVMAMARSYLRPLVATCDSPRDVLVRLNRLLYEDTSRDMFMSAVLLRWDGAARRLSYCGAGQEHLLIVRRGSERCEAVRAGGVALMMLDEAEGHLEDTELALDPGDLVVLYSDGVTESRAPDGRFFGLDRLVERMPAVARLGSAREVVERIAAEVRAFAGEGEQHDDITVVAFRRRSPPAGAP